jgi:ABC-type antimicrobial peptide transport system permease subunit
MPVIAAAGALAVAMLAATYLPARHLTRLDVADTMRSE